MKCKLTRHYIQRVFGIPIGYLQFEGLDGKYMTLCKSEYDRIVKQKYIEIY
jgi:hypothetical protein